MGIRPEPDAWYRIGPETPVVKWTHGVSDSAALEADLAAAAAETLSTVRARDGDRPA